MSESFTIRRADLADAPIIARHRAEMFRDMGELEDDLYPTLVEATRQLVARMIPAGEYVAWLAAPAGRAEAVAGAGVQLRTLLPRPVAGRGTIRQGPEAIVLNVYTEPAWRRKGAARALMDHVIRWARAQAVGRLVLHASADGRRLYEQLGFEPTNEMRFTGELDG
jgi:GNAT superfamily N-acetyltransferase